MVPFSSSFTTALAIVAVVPVSTAVFQNGDTCGVTSRDFMNYNYRSEYMVAGSAGCTIGGGDTATEEESGCFCAPNLEDGQGLGEWEWQCNNIVNFGPNPETGKVCPSKVPVPKGLGELKWVIKNDRARGLDGVEEASDTTPVPIVASVGTESQQQKLSVPCNLDLHPTGRPGDEVCPYSDCDDGGKHSAICACIDLEKYGMGTGTEWVCMHATCECEDSATDTDTGDDTEGAAATVNSETPPLEEEENITVEKEGTPKVDDVAVDLGDDMKGSAAASMTLASTTTTTGLFLFFSFSMMLMMAAM